MSDYTHWEVRVERETADYRMCDSTPQKECEGVSTPWVKEGDRVQLSLGKGWVIKSAPQGEEGERVHQR
jgi:hypothetical protein